MGLIFLRNKIASGYTPTDSDAAAYITAVETADGQALEDAVREAIDDFVIGCKADGIWTAIKASCILAGARTLNGALTPLVGTAPTNNNFVSGDYDRETGLVGDGSTKYIDSNRNNNADPQDDNHNAVWVTTLPTTGAGDYPSYIGAGGNTISGSNILGRLNSNGGVYRLNRSQIVNLSGPTSSTGLIGTTRNASANYVLRNGGSNSTITVASQTPINASIFVFAANSSGAAGYSPARMSFYSIGEALDLADLDSRVSTLMTDLGSAIP